MTELDRITVLSLFWRKGRKCFVPMTSAEVCDRLPGHNIRTVKAFLLSLSRSGWLTSQRVHTEAFEERVFDTTTPAQEAVRGALAVSAVSDSPEPKLPRDGLPVRRRLTCIAGRVRAY